jgi:F-box/TPR repeat protein Pof3
MDDFYPAASTFRAIFSTASRFYQAGQYDAALVSFNEVCLMTFQVIQITNLQNYKALLCSNSTNTYLVYDSRAAVFAKLGQNKRALEDARATIRVAPERWQGYARAARLFLKCNRIDASKIMVCMALDKLGEENTERRETLLSLQADICNALKRTESRRSDQFRKLPVEIFGVIAGMVVQQDPALLLPLSHVSRQWRYVVRNHSALWNVLVLSRRRPKEKATFWVERSKGAIKELHVHQSALDTHGWSGDGLQRLKWEDLRICKIEKWDIMAYLRSISKSRALSNLEQLEVDDIELKHCLTRDSIFNQDLKLQHLSMSYTKVNLAKLTKYVTNLTCLTLRYTSSIGELTGLLAVNAQLESLVLHYIGEDTVTTTQQFAMPRLSNLEVRGIAPRPIFDCYMPALRVLRLDSLALPLDRVLNKMVNESDIHLEELLLRSCRFVDSQSVIVLLQNSPDLRFLEVSNIAYQATSIIEALAASFPTSTPSPILRGPADSSAGTPVLCPYLTNVNFSSCPDVRTGSLVRLVKSRLPLHELPSCYHQEVEARQPPDTKRIISLAMDCCPLVDADFLSWFRHKVANVNCVYVKKRQSTSKGWTGE